MKILLDECVPRRLAQDFLGEHAVNTVPAMGWSGLDNGALLAAAETNFDVFLTIDQNLIFQQSITGFDIAVVVLCAKTNRYEDLRSLVPEVLVGLVSFQPGEAVRIGS